MIGNCCGCGKPLFGEHGKRLVDKCYQIAVMAKVNGGKYYSDRSLTRAYLCEECFNKPIAQVVSILKPVINNAQVQAWLTSDNDESQDSFRPM